jgi:large subunit ribosomal protein L6
VYELPKDVTAVIPAESKGQVLVLTSPDKAVLGQFSATLRNLRPAEPYGGKGVRYRGENIRRKAGKAGKGRK